MIRLVLQGRPERVRDVGGKVGSTDVRRHQSPNLPCLAVGCRFAYIAGLVDRTPSRAELVAVLHSHAAELRARGVETVTLFGSCARDVPTDSSDVDLAFRPRGSVFLRRLRPFWQAGLPPRAPCASARMRRESCGGVDRPTTAQAHHRRGRRKYLSDVPVSASRTFSRTSDGFATT